jgi:hypothetical protein
MPTDESRQQVRHMSAFGLTTEQVCLVFGITHSEFEHFYRPSFDIGGLEMTVEIASAVARAAKDPNHDQFFQCASFMLRARAGWRDIRSVETKTAEIPEEQKNKLINQIMDRLVTEKSAAEKVRA